MALRARIYAHNRHLLFDVAFICSTLTHCGVCDLSVRRLKWKVSYVHHRVWHWKWFSCQSSYVLQRLRLCGASDTVFRREIDSQQQWGYGTCYSDSFPRCEGVYSTERFIFTATSIHNQTCCVADSEEEVLPSKPQLVTQVSDPDPTFFDNVQKDVAKTLQKERIQEEFQKVRF